MLTKAGKALLNHNSNLMSNLSEEMIRIAHELKDLKKDDIERIKELAKKARSNLRYHDELQQEINDIMRIELHLDLSYLGIGGG